MVDYRILGQRGRITIPLRIRRKLGFTCNDVLSFREGEDGRSVIVRCEKICDDCGGKYRDLETDKESLLKLLDTLPADQQREALIHLSVLWAGKQEVK